MKKLNLQERQQILLRLLTQFDGYCKENELRYYLAGGTLLGAIRHEGFIPWDDDIDVYMPRPDYERLVQSEAVADNARIVTVDNSFGYYHPFNFCNVTDTKTMMVEHNVEKQSKKGASIDVFPMDGLPDDPRLRQKHLKKLMFWQSVLTAKIATTNMKFGCKKLCKIILKTLTFLFSAEYVVKKIDNMAKKYPFETSKDVTHSVLLFRNPKRFIVPRTVFDSSVEMMFENRKFQVPVGWQTILQRSYGNYMELPPEEKRVESHGLDIYIIAEGD